jgi:hypothetical protein
MKTGKRKVGRPPETDGGHRITLKSVVPPSVPSLPAAQLSAGRWRKACSSVIGDERGLSEMAPGLRQWGHELDSATTKKKHGAESLSAVKAESATCDSPQLVVEAFGASVGKPSLEEGEDTIFELFDGLRKFDKGFQPAPKSPNEPSVEFTLCVIIVGFIKDSGERFFEEICSVEGRIVALNLIEFPPLLNGEVPRIFEKDEFRFLNRLRLFRILEFLQLVDHAAPNLVESLGGELLNVKPIEDNRRIRRIVLDGFDICRRHVDGNGFEQCRSLFAELSEKFVEGLRALPLLCPDNPLSIVVDHDRDIAMSFTITELIDAYIPEFIQAVWIDVILDDTLDNIPDSTPSDAHNLGYLCLVSNLRQVGDLLLKRTSESAVVPSPRNQLNVDATRGTLHAPRGVLENNRNRGQGKMYPAGRLFLLVIARANPPTYRASRSKPRRSYAENKTAMSKSNKCDNNTGDLYQNSGKLIRAHVFSGALNCYGSKNSIKTYAFSFSEANLRDCRCLAA